MPNHFHLMVYADERLIQLKKQGGLQIDVLTNGIRKLLSGYARIFNSRHVKTGSLFRQKTKVKDLMNDLPPRFANRTDYYFFCFHYIHRNPWAAKLVSGLEDWDFLPSGIMLTKEKERFVINY